MLGQVAAIAGIGGLFDSVLHVGFQPVFIPLCQRYRHWVAPALCANLVGLLLQNGNRFLPGVAAGGSTPRLAGFVVNTGGQAHLPAAVCALADIALIVAAPGGFVGCVFHVASSPFVTQRLPQVWRQSYSSDPTIFGFSVWGLLTFCLSSQLSKSLRCTSRRLPM